MDTLCSVTTTQVIHLWLLREFNIQDERFGRLSRLLMETNLQREQVLFLNLALMILCPRILQDVEECQQLELNLLRSLIPVSSCRCCCS